MAAGGDRRVELLEPVGRALPAELGVRCADASGEPGAQLPVRDEAGELGGQRLEVAGLEQQAPLAVGERILVLGQAGGDRHGAAGLSAQQEAGGRSGAGRGGDDDVGSAQLLRLARRQRVGEADPVADPSWQRDRRLEARQAGEDRRLPGKLAPAAAAAHAGTSRSAERSSSSTYRISDRLTRSRSGRAVSSPPGGMTR